MLRLIATRAGLGVLTLFAVSVLIFVCTQILPGDVASAVLGQQATPEALKVFRLELGLDRPAYVRYFDWLFGVLRGDFGVALTNKRNILDELAPRFTNTLPASPSKRMPFTVGLSSTCTATSPEPFAWPQRVVSGE